MIDFVDCRRIGVWPTSFVVVLTLLSTAQLRAESLDDDGYELRISLPTQADYEQWLEPGFRLALGYGYGAYTHLEHSTDLRSHGISFRPHLRLSEDWGLGATINYGISKGELVQGLRWATTVELTYYSFEQLGLTLGVGLGGLWLTCGDDYYGQCQVYLELGRTEESRYLTERERISDCEGDGFVATARLDYQFVAGSNFASGPYLDVMAQSVRCSERTDKTSGDTGRPIEIWEYWSHIGMNIGWWFTWR